MDAHLTVSIASLTANRGGSALTTNAASGRHEDMKYMQVQKSFVKQKYTVAYKGAIAGHDQERCKQLLIDHGIAQKKAGSQ